MGDSVAPDMPAPVELRMNLLHEIETVTKHLMSADEAIRRQEQLISKFSEEGLPIERELDLLHSFHRVLTSCEAKLARLLHERKL